MKRPARVYLCAMLGFALTGCSILKRNEVQLTASSGLWERANLEYRIETRLLSATPSANRGELQLASYEQPLEAGLPANSVASVEIECPHPAGRQGLALVRVHIEGEANSSAITAGMSGWRKTLVQARSKLPGIGGPERIAETWTMEIPQAEVGAIVDRLRGSGYFNEYSQRPEEAQVSLELDGQRVEKPWSQLAELDSLVLRARKEGSLIARTGPMNREIPADAHKAALAAGASRSMVAQPGPSMLQRSASLVAYEQTIGADEGAAIVSDLGAPQR